MVKCYKNKNFIRRFEKQAERIIIDNNSKIVFISDVHRGDGGNSDSLRPNRNIYKAALNYYYSNNFCLLELGDGDELWKNKNFEQIAYNYDDIFAVLNKFNKKHNLYMIYGNHDMIKSNRNFLKKLNKKCSAISNNFGKEMRRLYNSIVFHECVILEYKKHENEIIAFHGHQVDYMNCNLWRLSRFLVRYIWRNMENVAGFKEPVSPSCNYNKGDNIDRALRKLALKEKKLFVCGHTHDDVFSMPQEGLYFNDGCCVFPSAVTAIEIEKGKISLVKWAIEVNKERYMYINRNIISGPQELNDYFNNENMR